MDWFGSAEQCVRALGGIPIRTRLELNRDDRPAETPDIRGWVLWRQSEPRVSERPYAVHALMKIADGLGLGPGLYDQDWDAAFECYVDERLWPSLIESAGHHDESGSLEGTP